MHIGGLKYSKVGLVMLTSAIGRGVKIPMQMSFLRAPCGEPPVKIRLRLQFSTVGNGTELLLHYLVITHHTVM